MLQRIGFVLVGICYKILQRAHRSGRIKSSKIAVFANDDLGLRIVCFGEFEAEILTFLRQNLPATMSQKLLIDVGANLGNHTNGLFKHFSHCHAFEADPRTFRLLDANVGGNTHVTCHEMAISNNVGTLSFARDEINTGKSHVVNDAEGSNSDVISVASQSIDSLDCLDKPVGLIKIDVEGHELQVLQGAEALLKKQKPYLLIELLRTDIVNGRAATLDFLSSLGYTKFSSIEKKTIKIDVIDGVSWLRWLNHVLHATETILFGQRPAQSFPINTQKLAKKNYEAILITAD